MKKHTSYFSHDQNAHMDPKIEEMMIDLGWSGYGLYWALIERLAQEESHKLPVHHKKYAFALRADENIIQSLIEGYNLFEIKDGFFYSKRLLSHFEEIALRSLKAKESAKARWGSDAEKDANAGKDDANAGDIESDCNANKIKGNNIIYNNIYALWNDQKIIEHSKVDPFISEIQKKLKKFSEEEISQAIKNYGAIFRNPKCFFTYKWTLGEFLKRKNGMEVFLYKKEEDYFSSRNGEEKKIPVTMTPEGRKSFNYFG